MTRLALLRLALLALVYGLTAVAEQQWGKATPAGTPFQMPVQQHACATKRVLAKAASSAATPAVLAFFDSAEFRHAS